MAKNNSVHAPYNFVSFPERPLLPYKSVDELPPHDHIDPQRRTGELHIALTAETPVFVAGEKGREPGDAARFFRTPDGTLAIPGSTIRGMTRENMQILGLAPVRVGEDIASYHIFYREIASSSRGTAGALKNYYRDELRVIRRCSASGKTYSIPENVQAGYIHCEGSGYVIYPTKGKKYFRISRSAFKKYDRFARTFTVYYKAKGERVDEVRNEYWAGALKGALLCTGKSVGKPNHLYLFPEEDKEGEVTCVAQDDVLSYKADWEKRKNGLIRPDFWKLPEPGEAAKPVFYIKLDGHVYFGMSLFLRIGYKHAIADGLPPAYKELTDEGPLDYPSAILGFSRGKLAYRSRVSFGDFIAEKGAQEGELVNMILGEPKPSYYPGYLRPMKSGVKNYNDDDFRLRGFKQYWLKSVQETTVLQGKENVATKLCPLPAGTRFCGVVRYKNLSDAELGLLLWSLCLNEGCFQSIGMGKPYGYGRMSVRVERMVEYAPDDLYSGALCPAPRQQAGEELNKAVRACIEAYEREAGGTKSKPLCEQGSIRDFLYMKRAIQQGEEFGYMQLGDYRNTSSPLPRVQDILKEEENRRANGPSKTMDEAVAKFMKKHAKPNRRK